MRKTALMDELLFSGSFKTGGRHFLLGDSENFLWDGCSMYEFLTQWEDHM